MYWGRRSPAQILGYSRHSRDKKGTYEHFLLFLLQRAAFDDLYIFQTREDVMLDLEFDFHAV
jgi:hypothetical protein